MKLFMYIKLAMLFFHQLKRCLLTNKRLKDISNVINLTNCSIFLIKVIVRPLLIGDFERSSVASGDRDAW